MHDPRLGRFFAIDPLAPDYPWNSPYAFSENVLINAVELEGLERKDIYNVYLDSKGGKTVVHVSTSYDEKLKSDQRVANYFDSKGNYIRTGRTNLDRKSTKIASPSDFISNQSDTKDFEGIVQNASDYEYEQNFVTAALKDFSADIWNACYQPVIDGSEQVVDPNSTVGERLSGVVTVITTLPSGGGPKAVKKYNSPRAAFRGAKREIGSPTSQTHITHQKVNVDRNDYNKSGTEFTLSDGKKIQKHPNGHPSHGYDNPHFNNHQPEGTEAGTKTHHEYPKKKE